MVYVSHCPSKYAPAPLNMFLFQFHLLFFSFFKPTANIQRSNGYLPGNNVESTSGHIPIENESSFKSQKLPVTTLLGMKLQVFSPIHAETDLA